MELASLLTLPGVAPLLALLNGGGQEARIVGGAVRNALLRTPVSDIDIAATLLPQETAALAEKAGWRVLPTGIEHGTVTVLAEGGAFEVTTLREDIETDGRRAKVRFGRDFKADALRRDFTINAMSLSPDGALHDYAGGVDDLARRRIRFIGEPAQRIAEDYLRILRFFRFHAAYGAGEMDRAGLAASVSARDGLAILAPERLRAEMLKLLAAPGAADAAQVLSETGLFARICGGVAQPGRLAALAADKPPADPLLRLAALAVFVEEDAERLRETLRLANHEHRRLAGLAQAVAALHGRPAPDAVALLALLFAHGRAAATDALRLRLAETGEAAWREALDFAAIAEIPRLPVSGGDLLARGARAGPSVGRTLKNFQAAWIRAGFPREPARLSQLLDAAMAAAHDENT